MQQLPASKLCIIAALCVSLTSADIYLHVPRGSNNRLNEKSAARKNANRMFDSQVRFVRSFNFMWWVFDLILMQS